MATHWMLGCDAAEPHRIATFWAAALGYMAEPGYDEPDGASIIDPDGAEPAIGFLRVPEAKTTKNRMHIDIRVAGEPPWDMSHRENLIRAKVAEPTAAGARLVILPGSATISPPRYDRPSPERSANSLTRRIAPISHTSILMRGSRQPNIDLARTQPEVCLFTV